MENNIDELVKNEKRKYYRNWRANNKEKIKETNKRYWLKRAIKEAETQEK